MKQTRAGKIVSEDEIPAPVVVSSDRPGAPQQTPSQPPAARHHQAAAPASIEIPRPSVISGGGQAPVPKPRASVQSPMDQPASSGPVPASGINVAKAAVNAPPVQLHAGPASDRATDGGNLCSDVLLLLVPYRCWLNHMKSQSLSLLVVILFFMHFIFWLLILWHEVIVVNLCNLPVRQLDFIYEQFKLQLDSPEDLRSHNCTCFISRLIVMFHVC